MMTQEEIDSMTHKQRIFCEEYVFDWNGTRAATVAGYSEKTAAVIASENLNKPNIIEYIKHLQANIPKLAGVSSYRNAKVLMDIAYTTTSKIPDKMKAIEVLNKMFGFDSPDKMDITSLGEKMQSPQIVFKKIENE